MKHIVTTAEIRDLGRPISSKVDEDKLLSYIYETERLNVKPTLGDKLFAKVLEYLNNEQGDKDENLEILLNGGEYTDKRDDFHMLSGLKMAISYFVYAQYVMDGDFQLTRAGVVIKDNSYSSHISSKERSDCYNNALTAANGFLNEVKDFIRDKFPQYYRQRNKPGLIPTNSIVIRKIGE